MDSSKSPSSSMRLLRYEEETTPPNPRPKNNFLKQLTELTESLELLAREAQDSENTPFTRIEGLIPRPSFSPKKSNIKKSLDRKRRLHKNASQGIAQGKARPHLILVP